MKCAYWVGIYVTVLGCHEPCKDGYGRAEDGLCYRLADDPLAPCGEGMGRNDEGECLPFGDTTDTADIDDLDGADLDGADDDADAGDGGADDAGSDGSSDPPGEETMDGSATIKGTISTTSGTGFLAGENVVLQAWNESAIDPETGWPYEDDTIAVATYVASAAISAMTIHYSFVVAPISTASTGVSLRLTAHLADELTDLEGKPRGFYPTETDEWLTVINGATTEEISIIIDNGEPEPDVSGPAPDEGSPVDAPVEPDSGPPVTDEGPPVDPDEGPPVTDEGPPVDPDEGPPVTDEGPPVDPDEGPPVDADGEPPDDTDGGGLGDADGV